MSNTHWHVGANMPGCLPEADPVCVKTVDEAFRAWQGEVTRSLEAVDDEDLFISLDTDRDAVTVDEVTSGDVSIAVEGYNIWVSSVDGAYVSCHLNEDSESCFTSMSEDGIRAVIKALPAFYPIEFNLTDMTMFVTLLADVSATISHGCGDDGEESETCVVCWAESMCSTVAETVGVEFI